MVHPLILIEFPDGGVTVSDSTLGMQLLLLGTRYFTMCFTLHIETLLPCAVTACEHVFESCMIQIVVTLLYQEEMYMQGGSVKLSPTTHLVQ